MRLLPARRHRIGGSELAKLERLCRYISRPALAGERLALTAGGEHLDRKESACPAALARAPPATPLPG